MSTFTVNKGVNLLLGPFEFSIDAGVTGSCPDDLYAELKAAIERNPGYMVTHVSDDRGASGGDGSSALPSGGTTGQLLQKQSATDQDADWVTVGLGDLTGDAGDVAITDADGNFTSDNVEGALSELADANPAASDTVEGATTYAISSSAGTAATYARGDHTHGSVGHDSHANLTGVTATDHHSNANDPTSGQKAALAGTSGTPGSGNKYVTDADTRMTNSRAPTGSAGGELSGTYPNPAVAKVNGVAISGTPTSGQIVIASSSTSATWSSQFGTLNIVIDGGGSAITTGVKMDVVMDFAGQFTAAILTADQSGSIVVNVWKDSYANFPPTVADKITSSAPPTLSSAIKSQDTTLTGWTTTFSAGDVFRFNVDSASTVTRVTLALKYKRT
jgi:hypothetical protein